MVKVIIHLKNEEWDKRCFEANL